MPLGEVIRLEKGRQLNKQLLSEIGLYPAYNGGVSYSGFTDTYNYNENTIIISQGGASAGFVNFVTSKFYANAHCYIVLPKPEIVQNRYVYHFLKLNQERLTDKQHGAGIPALRTSEILDIPIPIPSADDPEKSLAEQARIVALLDKFDALTNSISTGLPREIELRQKQYEYYRNLLLNFPKPVEVTA
ncbi:MAG: restriction endonuclease subunit S [Candidatus Tokpelaia sp.]|nr:MAG: restriction endonuclease subunit S [Candidatus Tokpelaia sp.]